MGRALDDELTDLSAPERAACYRQFAKRAEECAEKAQTLETRASFQFLAQQWDRLANQIASADLSDEARRLAPPAVCTAY
jgi:hypothetical protein